MTKSILPEDSRTPAFSFYPRDFLVGTFMLTLAECGAYIRLLCYQWDSGGVPDTSADRARILSCSTREADKVWARVVEKFDRCPDGLWRNARLEQERFKQSKRRAALAANGSMGGRPRKPDDNQKVNQTETNSFPLALANGNQNESLAFASSSSKTKTLSEKPRESSLHTRENTEQIRAGDFCEWYGEAHEKHLRVGYLGHPRNDYDAALRLVGKFSDEQIRDAALVWFGMSDDFATSGTRTVPKFASRITRCLELMRQKGIA